MGSLLGLLNGWKTVIAYLLMQIPDLGNFPGLTTAIQNALAGGSRQVYIELAIQILLAVGVSHRVVKNIKGDE